MGQHWQIMHHRCEKDMHILHVFVVVCFWGFLFQMGVAGFLTTVL